MAVRSYTLGAGRHIGLSLVLLLYMEIVTSQACSIIIPFWYVACYEDFNISKLDLYNVSLVTFHECAKDCADTSVCWSFSFDLRHDTCASYRLKSTNTSSFPEAKYFLKYGTEDTCTQAPTAECYRDASSGRADYAGRKITTESGITCQRWDQQSPHEHSGHDDPDLYPDVSHTAAENFCRDPDGDGYPWCYTTDPNVRWESCGIPHCTD